MVQLLWIAIVLLLTLACAYLWSWVAWTVSAIIVGGVVAWVLASALSPAVPDRACPQCRQAGLVKIRKGEVGVRCERCGFRDEAMHVAYLDEW